MASPPLVSVLLPPRFGDPTIENHRDGKHSNGNRRDATALPGTSIKTLALSILLNPYRDLLALFVLEIPIETRLPEPEKRSRMCATSVSIAEINTRLDEPANSFYSASSSPSSISEVELGQRSQYSEECVQNEPKANKVCEESGSEDATTPAGDTSLPTVDDRTSCCTAALSYINADVSSALSTSSTPRKRRWSQVVDENDECLAPAKRAQVGDDQDVRRPASPDSQEDQLRACSESADGSSLDQSAVPADDYDDDVCYSPAVDLDCSEARLSRRTLYIEYWSRTDECKERKWDHLDEIAEKYGSAEEHIFATTLNGRTACLEPNMFPYNTPDGIEHWTLWHVQDLTHEQVKQYVENWIDVNAPHVLRWNYDDNPERSIDIFHVHVYFQVGDADSVLQGRNFEDLVHECD